jgi:L-lysine 6-transaminase
MVRFGRFLEIMHEDGLVDNARVIGRRLVDGLRSLEQESGGMLSNSRGLGLMIAFDLPTAEMRKKLHERLLANGLLLLTCGTRSVRFRPPLNLTAAEADTALEIVRKSVKEL